MTTRLPEEASYLATARRRARTATARWTVRRERAWAVAKRIAEAIKRSYPHAHVRAFGSLLYPDSFGPQSDVDLALQGVGWPDYLHLWSALEKLEPEFEIDLVDFEIASPSLRRLIEREGVAL